MELEELSARLSDLERSRDEDRQKAAQQAFMGKYGSRISNNESLGLVVLNELNRRGVDTSAADEAVTEILDQLRMEATALLDAINDYKDKVDDVADAFETAEEVVGGGESDTSKPTSEVQEDLAVQPEGGEGGEMPETPPSDQLGGDMGAGAPPPPDMGGAPAPDMSAPPPDMSAPPPDMSAPPPPDQNMQLSDRRFKNIQNIVSDRRMKRIKQPAAKPAKPAVSNMLSEIINACRGGISNE